MNCINCPDEIQSVLVGKRTEYWHTYNKLEVGATMADCQCGCENPEPELQEKT